MVVFWLERNERVEQCEVSRMGSIWELLGITPEMYETVTIKDPSKEEEELPRERKVVEPRGREKKPDKKEVPLPIWLDQ